MIHPSALERFSIDIWDWRNVARKRGYQRNLDEPRIKKIAKYFERRDAIMPMAGLLNVREKGRLKFRDGQLTIGRTSVLSLTFDHRVVDGVPAAQLLGRVAELMNDEGWLGGLA